MEGQSNVETLRQNGVLPEGAVLAKHHEDNINALTKDEMQAVLDVHGKVGTIELPDQDPKYRICIF